MKKLVDKNRLLTPLAIDSKLMGIDELEQFQGGYDFCAIGVAMFAAGHIYGNPGMIEAGDCLIFYFCPNG